MTDTGRPSAFVGTRLSVMMFLQFFIWGAWYVTAPNYLGQIGFGPGDFGWTYSVGPIAGMISPFFVGMIADRFFSTERVLAAMHLMGGAIMIGATVLMKADEPNPGLINLVFFAHMLCFFPTLALTNTLAMKNIADSEKQFPLIRVFGTIGWIAAGLLLTWLSWDKAINMFYLTGGAALALGFYSITLPHTPPVTSDKPISAREILGIDALVLFARPSFLIFMFCSFLICIPLAFYYQLGSRVVEYVDLPIGLTMSYGQMSEILFMLVMPLFFRRLGVKWMLAIGMLAWVVRYGLFAMGAPDGVKFMIIAGIVLHGICYDFFFVTGQIYTDQVAPKEIRAQAQGMLVFFTLGLGMLIGAQVAGRVETHYSRSDKYFAAEQLAEVATQELATLRAAGAEAEAIEAKESDLLQQTTVMQAEQQDLKNKDWKMIWGIPGAFAGFVLLIFVLLFRDRRKEEQAEAEAAANGA